MKLAASNIAWPPARDAWIAGECSRLGIGGVEVAPTVLWPKPLEVSSAEVRALRDTWTERGQPIVALQALLFGRPDLTLFDDAGTRDRAAEYLGGIIRLGADLGAAALVFGSPKNRLVGSSPREAAWEIARTFFLTLGKIAWDAGTVLCIEPNPPAYGCDFVTNSTEARELVRAVGSPGFGLHLDAAALKLAGESPEAAIRDCQAEMRHFHASEPFLAPLGTGGVDHVACAAALRGIHYGGWVSLEMKQPDEEASVSEALDVLRRCYG